MTLTFVETLVFTRRIAKLGLEDELRDLQHVLVEHPDIGPIDKGTGGLRKVRIPDPGRGKGKRGGARVHYLWLPNRKLVYLMSVYAKDEDDALSAVQKAVLKDIVKRIVQVER